MRDESDALTKTFNTWFKINQVEPWFTYESPLPVIPNLFFFYSRRSTFIIKPLSTRYQDGKLSRFPLQFEKYKKKQ